MKRIITMFLPLLLLSSCSAIGDTITGAIQKTIQDTISQTVQGAESTVKDKLGDILGTGLSSSTVDASFGTAVRIKMDQTAYIKSDELKVKFIAVTEDSRCASDVQCIQAGQVTAQVSVTKNGTGLGNFTMTQRTNSTLNITKAGIYTLTLNGVEPAAFVSTRKPQSSEYYITMTVTK